MLYKIDKHRDLIKNFKENYQVIHIKQIDYELYFYLEQYRTYLEQVESPLITTRLPFYSKIEVYSSFFLIYKEKTPNKNTLKVDPGVYLLSSFFINSETRHLRHTVLPY